VLYDCDKLVGELSIMAQVMQNLARDGLGGRPLCNVGATKGRVKKS
jgi:hypothetical protein